MAAEEPGCWTPGLRDPLRPGTRSCACPPGLPCCQWSGLSRPDLYRLSVTDQDQFWGAAASRLRLMDTLNVSVNCLDVHVEKHPDRVALIRERDEPGTEVKVTHGELLETTCRLANTLKSHGIQKGDRVAIYTPISPMAVVAMLACARIGAVHTVVFAGFSSEALAGRIQDGDQTPLTQNDQDEAKSSASPS